ncbi:MAG: glycosyltransferase [Gammaproteobacteria bacterium]|nr:glycosyltransferase [Gammaproteobacteria bacterium]
MKTFINQKKISIITPSLNSEQFIERAIQSVLVQKYDNFEHIIVDGLSNDGTIEILKRYPHLTWISEKDSGQSQAMNKGFTLSTGNIIAYLNADDYYSPGIFSQVAPYFENGEKMVIGELKIVTNNGNTWIHKPSTDYQDILMHWKNLFPINPVQYFYASEYQKNLHFNEDNHLAMDHEFLLHLYKKIQPKKLDTIFGVFDMVDGSKTAEMLKRPEIYWSHKTFSYIDPFLEKLRPKEIISFKNKQYEFFNSQHKKNIFIGLTRLKDCLKNISSIIIYGAGTQFNAIHEIFTDKTILVVDKNSQLHGKLINNHKIQPLSFINTFKKTTILITPFGYKEEIKKNLTKMTNARLIFLEDFMQ